MNQPGIRRLHIARLELDLRGIDPAAAQAAVRALGPALERALAEHQGMAAPALRLDAGTIASPSRPAPEALATGIANTLARRITRSAP